MTAGFAPHHPDPRIRGEVHGRLHAAAVRHNIGHFLDAAGAARWEWNALRDVALAEEATLGAEERAELRAIADGAGVDHEAHLIFALTAHVIAPEECTVAAAVGTASSTGSTMLLKNSDKIGADSLVGDGYHKYKEINVVVDLRSDDDLRILGVAAAGSTNLKMGVNDAGIAAASNIVRTTELRLNTPSLDDLRALDRGRILRTGLTFRSAWEATTWTIDAISDTPMATPGNVHFAEPDVMFIVEGSYDRIAIERVQDRVVARSNMFVLLDGLNDPTDTSSPARYARALEMLEPHTGSVSVEHLRRVSQDHDNGPGLASICRHSDDFRQETSLSAMIASLDRSDRQRTRVDFALGKPCWAWAHPEGAISVTTLDDPEEIAGRFRDGEAWVDLYREDPFSS